MAVDHRHHAQRAQDALDQDVHRYQHGRDHPALREGEPVNEVQQRLAPNHRPNQIRMKAITPEATARSANCERTIRLGATGRSMNLTWMIVPARVRNVKL